MKKIKLLVGMLLLVFVLSVGCTSNTSYQEISFDGVIDLCREKSGGNVNIFTQCLDNQQKATGKLIDYLNTTLDIEGYQNCLKKNTDDNDRSDLVKVGMCLGLGSSKNTI